jgi:hypothetical protein
VCAQARPAHFVQRRPYSYKQAIQQSAAVDIMITIRPVLGEWLQHEWATGGDIGTPYTLSKAVSWRGLTLSHPHATHVHVLLHCETAVWRVNTRGACAGKVPLFRGATRFADMASKCKCSRLWPHGRHATTHDVMHRPPKRHVC